MEEIQTKWGSLNFIVNSYREAKDKFWRDIMVKTNKRPLVYDCCASEELLRKIQKNNKELEEIQKKMEDYLEVKRAAFPRFYFLSNDELLEILAKAGNL